MINVLCTNMGNHHLFISYITRGYSNQILIYFSIIRQVSSFIQVKWKPAPLPPRKKTIKKQKQKQKQKQQINKQRQKKKDKKQTKRYCDQLICILIHTVLYQGISQHIFVSLLDKFILQHVISSKPHQHQLNMWYTICTYQTLQRRKHKHG